MKKKILLCLNKNQFVNFDYNLNYITAMQKQGFNSGNNVFEYAVQKMLLCKDVKVEYNYDLYHNQTCFEKYIPEINEKFDCIIILPANIFGSYAMKFFVPNFINYIQKLKIPVYVLGAGAQSDFDYSFDFLDKYGKLIKDFVNAVAKTNGKIGLRGYFTAECLKKLGLNEDVYDVIGCPSIFQNGRDLRVDVVPQEHLKIAFNGNRMLRKSFYKKYFDKYNDAIFVCQDELYKFLYRFNEIKRKDLKNIKLKHIENLLQNNSVKLYCNYQSWVQDLQNQKINFSYGTRIHGNIVPILSNIPSVVEVVDSRTRELTEYFDIPSVKASDDIYDIEEIYNNISYKNFNESFSKKFDKFKKFMNDCGLPCLQDIEYINKVLPPMSDFTIPESDFKELSIWHKIYRSILNIL